MKLQQIIERHWYQRPNLLLAIILFIPGLIYAFIITVRKWLFMLHLKPSTKIKVPVVVIGNISVGGAGKTPLTKYLAQKLSNEDIKIGIILRGYKSSTTAARIVRPEDTSDMVGDEALIYAQNGFTVAIGAKRVDAAKLLLQQFPDTQLILADDGMQHYYLDRDLEICVIDSSRIFGNRQLLPMGPLREPLRRLNSVDAIVINGSDNQAKLKQILKPFAAPIYLQELEFIDLFNPLNGKYLTLDQAQNIHFMAIAAIGNPERFFSYLRAHGLILDKCQAYPDHYFYQTTDIDVKYAIITTEKDYTKLVGFKASNIWVARVSAKIDSPQLIATIKQLIPGQI